MTIRCLNAECAPDVVKTRLRLLTVGEVLIDA